MYDKFIERMKKEGRVVKREVIVKRPPMWGKSYWNSIDVKNLTPEQRKHFKAIMRKEVRKTPKLYGKRPKCDECRASLTKVFVRKETTRYHNLGWYCKFCESIHINNGIKIICGPVYIGLERVIK